jgi:hypothetical protein
MIMTTQTTPQMTEEQHRLLTLGIESEVRSAERMIEDFKTRFAKDPMHALSWSDGLAGATAMAQLGGHIHSQLEKDGVDYDIQKMLRKLSLEMRNEAQHPSHSTSPMSNLVAQAQWQGKAKLVGRLEEFIEFMNK